MTKEVVAVRFFKLRASYPSREHRKIKPGMLIDSALELPPSSRYEGICPCLAERDRGKKGKKGNRMGDVCEICEMRWRNEIK